MHPPLRKKLRCRGLPLEASATLRHTHIHCTAKEKPSDEMEISLQLYHSSREGKPERGLATVMGETAEAPRAFFPSLLHGAKTETARKFQRTFTDAESPFLGPRSHLLAPLPLPFTNGWSISDFGIYRLNVSSQFFQ